MIQKTTARPGEVKPSSIFSTRWRKNASVPLLLLFFAQTELN